ncbi:MAG: ribose-phosphate pyrophosphokinase [Clostridiales bacterium]|nr:ribose-phosphate pyrophosphokinase [Clostridiales bacterium]MCD7827583.1 ribose-phosphate pyrophosphokinase [Clostridiales bacterium]
MPDLTEELTQVPVGPLGIIALPGCTEFAKKVDDYIVSWRREQISEHKSTIAFSGYQRDSYLMDASFHRFGTGEGKAVIHESVRGYDIYLIVDVFNYGITHNCYGIDVPMTPDEHFANLKRAIAACAGKAERITVIMPMLYEGRQHKRTNRESLDCALALQELCVMMGVDNIITFDAHDARVQNAIPLKGFENVTTTYQMIKALVRNVDNFKIDKDHLMIISPDEGGIQRCIYYSSVLGVELGMFYKRRDYSTVVGGRNPILAHEFLGDNVEGKDVIVVDDMISSGDSMLEVTAKLKELKANRIYVCSAFGLFCNGLEAFDEAYEKGTINGVFTTNLIYQTQELLKREWYHSVDVSKYVALLIDTLNNDKSLSKLLSPGDRIEEFLKKNGYSITKN